MSNDIKYLMSIGYPYKIIGNDGYLAVLSGMQPLNDGEISALYRYPGGTTVHSLDEINRCFEVVPDDFTQADLERKNVAESLMNIENDVYYEFKVDFNPLGIKSIKMILRMSELILERIDIDSITPEVLKILENENFHMVSHAADIILKLDKYSLRKQ